MPDDQVKTILAAVWGPHCRLVGDEYVEKIEKASAAGAPVGEIIATARGGDNFDWVESIRILAEAAEIILAMLELYKVAHGVLSKRELAAKARAELVKPGTNAAVASKVEAAADLIAK